jgi:predicted 2-oxoglutarate/Fe(II)-dependent dioxygenase YbiX
MLPVRMKPEASYVFSKYVKEFQNVLSNEQVARIRNYTLNENSGLHRRGSKSPGVHASFYTCLMVDSSDQLYADLNYLWEPFKDLTFIEPYEIKLYVEGDVFGEHRDGYVNLTEGVSRRMNIILQLSDTDEYEGGDLLVGDYVCTRQKGSAIMFPSLLPHQVTEITKGQRYSLIGHGWGPINK